MENYMETTLQCFRLLIYVLRGKNDLLENLRLIKMRSKYEIETNTKPA